MWAKLEAAAPVWRPGLLAMLVLAPFFFLSYGAANHWAAAQAEVPSIVFDWERHIPLLPWTILPYWSIDLFYGLSLLLSGSALVLRRQVLRLVSAQLLCITCFYLWPLKFSTPRPALDGWEGALFNALAGFDLPYNQAPSLHIVLLLILWDFYRQRVDGLARWGVHAWSLLIGVSVLTTYQHHAIDIPTGMLAGGFCMWLWPLDGPTPWQQGGRGQTRHGLTMAYAGGALLMGGMAWWLGAQWSRLAWLLWWPCLALSLVSLAYLRPGLGVFQKDQSGRHTAASQLLLAPYRWFAWLNARGWTVGQPSSVDICDGVWLGRLPLPWEPDHARFHRILDVTAELSCPHHGLTSVPMLDLAVPHPDRLREAATHLTQWSLRSDNPVLVCCALGYARSAAVVLTWLCVSGRARSLEAAIALVRHRRPQVVLSPALLSAVAQAVKGEAAR